MEFGLLRGEPCIGGAAVLLDAGHQCLQAVDQGRHQRALLLLQLEGLAALVRVRIRVQRGGNLQVELLHGLQALTPAQRRQQPEHGRGGNAGDGGAERERQAFHRCRQRAADGLQVGGALQRKTGALERGHHAKQGAEHAQQHQQADQVRRKHRRRQRHAFALDAQAHGVAQPGGHGLQPVGQRRGCAAHTFERVLQRNGGLAVVVQLPRTGDVARPDDRGDQCAERVGAEVTDADPAHRQQADKKHENGHESSEHDVPISGCEALQAGLR